MHATSSITASEFWQTHEALGKTEGQTEFQRQEAVTAFEREHATVCWRIRITEVSQFGTVEGWANKPGFWGEKFSTPIEVRFGYPKPQILGRLNKGDICVVKGTPKIEREYVRGTSDTDWEGHFSETLYLENATIEVA